MMKYLIDTENVQYSWARLLPSLLDGDLLSLYYSKSSAPIPISVLDIILARGVRIEVTHCTPGANAMDFQLVTDLGRRIAAAPADAYVVVSNDAGFDAAIYFWKARNISIRRLPLPPMNQKELLKYLDAKFPDIMQSGAPKPVDKSVCYELPLPDSTIEKDGPIERCKRDLVAAGATKYQANTICEIVLSTIDVPSRKNKIYTSTLEEFGQTQGIEVYQKYVKPIAYKTLGVV